MDEETDFEILITQQWAAAKRQKGIFKNGHFLLHYSKIVRPSLPSPCHLLSIAGGDISSFEKTKTETVASGP